MTTATTEHTTNTMVPSGALNEIVNTTPTQVADLDHPEGEAIRRQVSSSLYHSMNLR
jgi:hypothetical protein